MGACGGHEDGGNKTNPPGSAGSGASAAGGAGASPDDVSDGGASSSVGGTSSATGGTRTSGAGSGGMHDSGTPGFDAGLPKDKPLNSLSPDEQAAICSRLKTYFEQTGFFESQQELSCRASGLVTAITAMSKTDAEARAVCQSTYDACAAMPADVPQCTPPGAACTATVGELDACMSDLAGFLREEGKLIPTCAELTLADLGGIGTQPELPASCQLYDAKCPDNGQVEMP